MPKSRGRGGFSAAALVFALLLSFVRRAFCPVLLVCPLRGRYGAHGRLQVGVAVAVVQFPDKPLGLVQQPLDGVLDDLPRLGLWRALAAHLPRTLSE